jgi:hypothetical protein
MVVSDRPMRVDRAGITASCEETTMTLLSPRLLSVSACLAAALATGAHAGLGTTMVETVYATPTTSVLTLPTAYYAPVSYTYYPTVYSTSYYTPTVASSSVLSSSYYVPTTYYYTSRYWFPRRWRYLDSTAYYLPTSYYTPTVYSYPLVTTSAVVDPNCVVAAPAPSVPTSGSMPGSNYGAKSPLSSTPRDSGTEPGLSGSGGGKGSSGDATQSPPASPSAGKEGTEPPNVEVPIPAGPAGVERRDSRKPPANELQMRAAARPAAMMSGRVTAGATGAAIPNTKVTFISVNNRFGNKTFTTDDQGRFHVPYLPEGDWSVEVSDAEGKGRLFDGLLTVSNGRITDADGRAWTSLNLSR